jgi:hypothetical protein
MSWYVGLNENGLTSVLRHDFDTGSRAGFNTNSMMKRFHETERIVANVRLREWGSVHSSGHAVLGDVGNVARHARIAHELRASAC